jgi:hypothetical protein
MVGRSFLSVFFITLFNLIYLIKSFLAAAFAAPPIVGAVSAHRQSPAGSSGVVDDSEAIEIDEDDKDSGEEIKIMDERITPASFSLDPPPSASISSSSLRLTRSQTRLVKAEVVLSPRTSRVRPMGPIYHPEPSTPGRFGTPCPVKPHGRPPKKAASKKGKEKAKSPPSGSEAGDPTILQVEDIRAEMPELDTQALGSILNIALERNPVSSPLFRDD